jgi:hypothetical protein
VGVTLHDRSRQSNQFDSSIRIFNVGGEGSGAMQHSDSRHQSLSAPAHCKSIAIAVELSLPRSHAAAAHEVAHNGYGH